MGPVRTASACTKQTHETLESAKVTQTKTKPRNAHGLFEERHNSYRIETRLAGTCFMFFPLSNCATFGRALKRLTNTPMSDTCFQQNNCIPGKEGTIACSGYSVRLPYIQGVDRPICHDVHDFNLPFRLLTQGLLTRRGWTSELGSSPQDDAKMTPR